MSDLTGESAGTGASDGAASFVHQGGKHADIGVLVCHGFTGTPRSIRPWADHLAAEGYAVRAPLLPGHGTRWQDANNTTFDDWLATVTAELAVLSATCRMVFVAGLSMGGTLALRLAQQHPDTVAGLILVNPSVMTTRLDAKFAPVLGRVPGLVRRLLPSLPGIADDIAKPGVTEGGYDRIPVLAALSLQRAWPVVRGDLGKIGCPLLLLHSTVDHVVEPENSAIVLRTVASSDKREVLLENSFHVATLDNDAPTIFAESVAFIQRVAGR